MNEAIRQLQPTALWNYFADLNAVPRPSKKEERVIKFIKDFGESLSLDTMVDEAGNVIIKKPATKGMEGSVTVVLQSHLDMVHQKNADTVFDFNTQCIEMYTDGDWVKAKGTTLGADNGIGVAAIMVVLASTDIPHPALEALFTIDEETGLTGAMALKGGLLAGEILLNLDTEEDNELTIGCAGGVDITASGKYETVTPQNEIALQLMIKGLTGGHSGSDIHKGRANANKLMNRLLWNLSNKFQIEINSIEGGTLRNAIPRESVAVIVVATEKQKEAENYIREYEAILKKEYNIPDPQIAVTFSSTEKPAAVLDTQFQQTLLKILYACPNGIYRMSSDIEGLVQTSNNLSRVMVKDGAYSLQCLTRGSVDTEKNDLANAITSAFQLLNAEVAYGNDYPGWTPNPQSSIVTLMSGLYKEMFGEEANVNACHAGLECGILGRNYPAMQMISFGPTIHGAHSPDEKAKISSVQKFWNYLQETLKRI